MLTRCVVAPGSVARPTNLDPAFPEASRVTCPQARVLRRIWVYSGRTFYERAREENVENMAELKSVCLCN